MLETMGLIPYRICISDFAVSPMAHYRVPVALTSTDSGLGTYVFVQLSQ